MLRKFLPLMMCVAVALGLTACGGGETNSNSTTNSNANKSTTTSTTTTTTSTPATTSSSPATTNSSPATTSSSPAATTAPASGEKIGIADCDDFLSKYEACVNDKVPAAARAQYESSIKQWRDSWRQLAANPQTKGTLVQVCKSAAEQAKTSMTSFGCSF
ncbi:MAG TPA: hypothetical protein VF528_17030 [Pyrinomonadaceae bacterium]